MSEKLHGIQTSNVKPCLLDRNLSYYLFHKDQVANWDFDPLGKKIAIMDWYGVVVLADVDTNNNLMVSTLVSSKAPNTSNNTFSWVFVYMKSNWQGSTNRCRWSPLTNDPIIYLKFNYNTLNLLDIEKQCFLLENELRLADSRK